MYKEQFQFWGKKTLPHGGKVGLHSAATIGEESHSNVYDDGECRSVSIKITIIHDSIVLFLNELTTFAIWFIFVLQPPCLDPNPTTPLIKPIECNLDLKPRSTTT